MSEGYSDEQLLASARQHAFEGLITITALSDERKGVKRLLREHFESILTSIDVANAVGSGRGEP